MQIAPLTRILALALALPPMLSLAQDENDSPSSAFSGLRARSIGPALMSGRVGDFAVNPRNRAHYFVAACSGGVWKTTNAGTTFQPVFDGQGSYSIGCVTMDPNNPNVVWVGTGENNSQRSVSFGDGVYRSRDGGKTWQNVGLKESEHIGMISIHKSDSDTVYVAAQGPLWRAGGQRGLYKTTDGGDSWKRVLHVNEDTGINEVHIDPRDPEVLFASAYQRRRHVWTLIDGGPHSGIHKSTDGGQSWRKLSRGIPGVDKGRIGLDIAPANPDVLYAIVEAAGDQGGVFRSTDRGETWEKRSSYMSSSPQYYNEIVCDPTDSNRVYSLDTFLQVTVDGGRNFQRVPIRNKHVDDHALWIDPEHPDYLLVGCDGGIYDSYDRGRNWSYKPNLPLTQFYRVSVDNALPFYNVYGGTQDNNSQGGPSRTTSRAGITNEDWFITVGGDGYETQVDPEDPNIVYSQYQYGGLVRHDRRSGQIVDIKPREAAGGEPYRWNWDTPLLISPHNRRRLYFAGNKLFQSNNGGMSWQAISDDLTRRLDRNKLKVFGQIQGVDAVAKHRSTSIYGNSVSLDESPLEAGLIYVGTDDGLVQVTENGGTDWRKIGLFPGVPDRSYVSCITASSHDADTVFAAFDNHKMGDFRPYLLKSNDRGRSWHSLSGNLPDRDIVYSIKQDHVDADLLFAGTEFGAYFTQDAGETWTKIRGLPTIAVRDIAIQQRENDVVFGTFGRGFYILDDYTPLRLVDQDFLDKPGGILPVKTALRYIPRTRLGGRQGLGSQGASFYAAANPSYGAVITYYLNEKLTTRRERRKEAEKSAARSGKEAPYPTLEELRAEDEETVPAVQLTIRDQSGQVVRRLKASRAKGLHRIAWDLRYPSSAPISLSGSGQGPLALPGEYSVELAKIVDGETTPLAGPSKFTVVELGDSTFDAQDREQILEFQQQVARLQRAVGGAVRVAAEAGERLDYLRRAVDETPAAESAWLVDIERLRAGLRTVVTKLSGDRTRSRLQDPTPPSVNGRIRRIVGDQWNVTSPPTQTQRDAYQIAGQEFTSVIANLRVLIRKDLVDIEKKLESAGAPWTPGRILGWQITEPAETSR